MEFIQRSERWLQLKDLDGEIWKDVVGYENLYEEENDDDDIFSNVELPFDEADLPF